MSTPDNVQPAAAKPAAKPIETMGLEDLKKSVDTEVQRRKIIQDFVSSQLKEGVDYGRIKIGGREGKPTLFKPGMEKIFSLFNIVSHLRKDEETLSMLEAKDVIVYKCELYRDGQFLSQGRGACTVAEKGRINDAIKIAEKRARMDACLNLGFSEYFTQDLEDMQDEPLPSATSRLAEEEQVAARTTTYSERLLFTVNGKEELTAQSGNPYAKLSTDKGTVIAFRNTMDKFEAGKTYFVSGVWEKRKDSKAFLITSTSDEIRPVPSASQQETTRKTPAKTKAKTT